MHSARVHVQEFVRAAVPRLLSFPRETVNPPYENFQSTARFGSLDGLRALSVLAVIWHHVGTKVYPDGVLSRGFLGVWVFFAISGFLITTLLLRERAKYGEISLRLFYWKRSLRIFPLYYTVLFVYLIGVFLFQRYQPAGQEFFKNLPYYATYTSNWFVPFKGRVIFYFAWSLATEEQFYLVWPWVEKLIPSSAVWVVSAVIGVHLACAKGIFGFSLLKGSLAEVVLTYISVPLCLGVLLAHGLHNKRSFPLLQRLLYPRHACIVWLTSFAALFLLTGFMPSLGSRALQEVLLSMTIVLLVGSCVIREDHMLAPFLRHRLLASCGVVSYGMYLMHMLCVNMASVILRRLHLDYTVPEFFLSSVLAYAVAMASFYHYESWFLKHKKLFDRARQPVA